MALIASMLCLSLNSCGGDDDGKPEDETTNGGSNTPEDNLPEASKAFIGYWLNSLHNSYSKHSDYFFREDGTCDYIFNDGTGQEGYWTYNPATSILATSIYGSQWQITLSNNESWAGIIASGKAQAFNRASQLQYINEYFKWHKWKAETGRVYEDIETYLKSLYSNQNLYISIEENENTEDFIFKYKINDSYINGTITINNPYHSTKCQLVFSGGLKQTLTIYNDK